LHLLTLFFLNENYGWAATANGVLRTIDGTNFTKVNLDDDKIPAIHFTDQQHGALLTFKGQIYKSADGGQSWQKFLKVNLGDPAYDIHFFDENHGYVSGQTGVIKIDGNDTTRVVNVKIPNEGVTELFFTDKDHGWAGTYKTGGLFKYVAPQ